MPFRNVVVCFIQFLALLRISIGKDDKDDRFHSFNVIDFNNPIWLKQEQDETYKFKKDDLFGFSLALGKGEVYIGAPGYNRSGTLFHCPIAYKRFDRNIYCNDINSDQRTFRPG